MVRSVDKSPGGRREFFMLAGELFRQTLVRFTYFLFGCSWWLCYRMGSTAVLVSAVDIRSIAVSAKSAVPLSYVMSKHQPDIEYFPLEFEESLNCLCAFHQDSNPSLVVTDLPPRKPCGLYYCFSCGAAGDVIDFLRNKYRISFRESVTLVAIHAWQYVNEYPPPSGCSSSSGSVSASSTAASSLGFRSRGQTSTALSPHQAERKSDADTGVQGMQETTEGCKSSLDTAAKWQETLQLLDVGDNLADVFAGLTSNNHPIYPSASTLESVDGSNNESYWYKKKSNVVKFSGSSSIYSISNMSNESSSSSSSSSGGVGSFRMRSLHALQKVQDMLLEGQSRFLPPGFSAAGRISRPHSRNSIGFTTKRIRKKEHNRESSRGNQSRGVDDDLRLSEEEMQALRENQEKVLLVQALANQFFTMRLLKDPAAQHARDYLLSRGISVETVHNFRIGYAPGKATGSAPNRTRGVRYASPYLARSLALVPSLAPGFRPTLPDTNAVRAVNATTTTTSSSMRSSGIYHFSTEPEQRQQIQVNASNLTEQTQDEATLHTAHRRQTKIPERDAALSATATTTTTHSLAQQRGQDNVALAAAAERSLRKEFAPVPKGIPLSRWLSQLSAGEIPASYYVSVAVASRPRVTVNPPPISPSTNSSTDSSMITNADMSSNGSESNTDTTSASRIDSIYEDPTNRPLNHANREFYRASCEVPACGMSDTTSSSSSSNSSSNSSGNSSSKNNSKDNPAALKIARASATTQSGLLLFSPRELVEAGLAIETPSSSSSYAARQRKMPYSQAKTIAQRGKVANEQNIGRQQQQDDDGGAQRKEHEPNATAKVEMRKLASVADRNIDIYDRFRDRLMIPIRDVQGRVLGFGGRILPEYSSVAENESSSIMRQSQFANSGSSTGKSVKTKQFVPAKYINSPSSCVFQKKNNVFGLDLAAFYIAQEDFVIIVEGYFDVISLHDVGVRNVVASMGTAISVRQVELAASFCPSKRVVLLMDGDDAGRTAVQRLVDKFRKQAGKVFRRDNAFPRDECIQGLNGASGRGSDGGARASAAAHVRVYPATIADVFPLLRHIEQRSSAGLERCDSKVDQSKDGNREEGPGREKRRSGSKRLKDMSDEDKFLEGNCIEHSAVDRNIGREEDDWVSRIKDCADICLHFRTDKKKARAVMGVLTREALRRDPIL